MKKRNKLSLNAESGDISLNELERLHDSIAEENGAQDTSKPSPSFTDKLNYLFADVRSFKVRLIIALLCSLAFSFTFILFGPYEIYLQGASYLTFGFADMAVPIAITAAVCFLVLSGVLMLLRGKVFNYAVSLLFAFTFAGYIQGTNLNVDHGSLDGTTIDWATFTTPMIKNTIVWALIPIIVFAIMYFSRRIWAYAVQLVSVVIVGAQIIALISVMGSADIGKPRTDCYISDEGCYEVSDDTNVVFFLLDRFDSAFADEMLESHPDWSEKLGGFTYYTNFTGSYTRTMPSIVYLLTGVKTSYDIPYQEYFEKAYSEGSFLRDVHDAGIKTKVYTDSPYVFGSAENVYGLIDNAKTAKQTVKTGRLLSSMLQLSAYRYSPEAMKPYFHMYTGDLADVSTIEDDEANPFTVNDYLFWRNYRESGLTVETESNGNFLFYHFLGAHEPFVMDENAEDVLITGQASTRQAQIDGNMKMIFNYIEELKAKGLYDKTTIIISADHARTGTLPELDYQRVLSLFIKPAGADTATPLAYSNKEICQDNLRASMVSYFGLDTSGYARTIESIGENEPMVRYFWMQACDETQEHRDVSMITYEINGDANYFSNWKKISQEPIVYPFYDAETTPGL